MELLLVALGLGVLWMLSKTSTSSATPTSSPVATPISAPGVIAIPISVTSPACSPAFPSMAYALLSVAAGGGPLGANVSPLPGSTLMSGAQWDGMVTNKLLQPDITGFSTMPQYGVMMTACDYVNLRASLGLTTLVALYQPSSAGVVYTTQ